MNEFISLTISNDEDKSLFLPNFLTINNSIDEYEEVLSVQKIVQFLISHPQNIVTGICDI